MQCSAVHSRHWAAVLQRKDASPKAELLLGTEDKGLIVDWEGKPAAGLNHLRWPNNPAGAEQSFPYVHRRRAPTACADGVRRRHAARRRYMTVLHSKGVDVFDMVDGKVVQSIVVPNGGLLGPPKHFGRRTRPHRSAAPGLARICATTPLGITDAPAAAAPSGRSFSSSAAPPRTQAPTASAATRGAGLALAHSGQRIVVAASTKLYCLVRPRPRRASDCACSRTPDRRHGIPLAPRCR